ncbi:MAG: hypothetical protein ACK56I_06845, partial [bacterium]
MISLRPGELPQANRHHLEKAALNLARKVGMPLHPPNQHHPIGPVRLFVEEGFNAVGVPSQGNHFELADHRATHGRLRDLVVGQHVRLPFRRRRPVTAHGRENERLTTSLLPVTHHRLH